MARCWVCGATGDGGGGGFVGKNGGGDVASRPRELSLCKRYTTSAPEASVEMATKFRLSFGFE